MFRLSLPGPGTSRRLLGSLVAAALLSVPATVQAQAQAQAQARAASPLPGGLGPCVPGSCPDDYPPINNGTITYRDNAVNIYVGGDFLVRARASEAEGRIVVLGTFDMAKAAGNDAYTIGEAGVGSRVAPPVGSDWLSVGGDITIASGQRLLAEDGVVRYAGTADDTIISQQTVKDPDAVTQYVPLRNQLTSASQCYAHPDGGVRPATGTAVHSDGQTLFTGDGTSPLQVFNVDFDMESASGGQEGIVFAGIPSGATVLVNVLGTSRTINTYSGTIDDSSDFNKLRNHLLWNFPDATDVQFKGTAQFQGSVLIGNQSSMATIGVPGMNGRFFTTGSLTHTSAGESGGQEFHNYPFDGDLPDCNAVNVTGEVKVLKTDRDTGKPLAGAEFELWEDTNGTPGLQTNGPDRDTLMPGGPCTTPTSGACRRTVDLGTYYWRETKAPDDYVRPTPDVFGPLTLTAANAADGVSVTATNRHRPDGPTFGQVRVLKKDRATGKPLSGAVFQLWRETNGTAGLQTSGATADTATGAPCTTGTTGVCARTVTPGTFYWSETRAPAGYTLPSPAVFGPLVLTTANASAGVSVTALNSRPQPTDPKGRLTVVKKDRTSGKPLPGAVFRLWRDTNGKAGLQTSGARRDTPVGPGCATDSRGRCVFGGLPLGRYYLRETAVPEGYVLPRNPVSGPYRVTAANTAQGVTVTLTNRRGEPGKGKK